MSRRCKKVGCFQSKFVLKFNLFCLMLKEKCSEKKILVCGEMRCSMEHKEATKYH